MEPSKESSNPSNQARCCMLVLCGIPGSGKTTIAAALAAAAEASGTSVTSINFDTHPAERLSFTDPVEDFNPEKWKADRAASLHAVSQALLSSTNTLEKSSDAATTAATNISNGKHLVIVDDTMHYRSMRAECWHIARTTGAAYLYSHIKCPLEIALERNNNRPPGQRVPEHVLKRTAAIFEPPEEKTSQSCPYDSEKYRVVLHTEKVENIVSSSEIFSEENEDEKMDGEVLWACVKAAWGPPAPAPFDEEAEEARISLARKATEENLLHQVDVQTRKHLTEVLSSINQQQHQQGSGNDDGDSGDRGFTFLITKEEKKKIAEELNIERRRVLDNFRSKLLLKNELIKEEMWTKHAKEIVDAFEKQCREYIN